MSGSAREALAFQLWIERRFADDFVIGHVSDDAAHWHPGGARIGVTRQADGWHGDWPVDDGVGTPTIGWLLWHVEWWWTDTLAAVAGEPAVAPQEFRWSGGTDRLIELFDAWQALLADADLDRQVRWGSAGTAPLWKVAGWVQFELAKNLAEVNHLQMLREAGDAARHPAG